MDGREPASYDVVVVGAGTAGCVLAARLSERSDRSVCLVEAGPDYGPLGDGRWPADMLDAGLLPTSHDWGTGGEDGRTLGARIVGGCSAHNACIIVRGTPADYDEWGPGWEFARFAPYLDRAHSVFSPAAANTERPAPMHEGFLAAAAFVGLDVLDDPDDPTRPTGACAFPANAVDGVRRNAAFAYLDPARERPNLTIAAETLVDRVAVRGRRVVGVLDATGRLIEAGCVILAAGAYFTPGILVRSGIGPEAELRRLGIEPLEKLPVGETLLDHCGSGIAWEPTELLQRSTADHDEGGQLFEPHVLIKAASSACPPGTFDLHILPWLNRSGEPGRYEASAGVFHIKPHTAGRVRLRSTDPNVLPEVTRGFLERDEDAHALVEGFELARSLAASPSLRQLLGPELRPAAQPIGPYLRETVRGYFHPAGTCPIGPVVDADCRVLGIEGLVVADASVMPTIPRANTNLTAAAIGERVADTID